MVRRMVFASSSSVYGASVDGARREDSRTAPLSPYAESKLEGERRCASESTRSGLETIALRYFNVYGPRQPLGGAHGAAVPRFIESGLLRRPITIFGDGRQVRDFTYVDDIVEANVLALTARLEAATAVNVGRGSPTQIMRLAEMAMKAAGCSVPVEYTAPRAADVPYSVADTAHARQLLGFVAAHTLAEGLRATVDHRSMALADEATAI